MRKFIIRLLIKIIAFYYRIGNYIDVMSGQIIVNPGDVRVDTSIVWRGEIAPPHKVFYIAKLKLHGVYYTKNVAVYRKDLSIQQELMLKWKAQRLFAESLTRQLNK